jgi:hypothetical protein
VLQFFNRLVDLYEILYEDDGIKDSLDSMLDNPAASTIPKCSTFRLMWWMQLLN